MLKVQIKVSAKRLFEVLWDEMEHFEIVRIDTVFSLQKIHSTLLLAFQALGKQWYN